MAETMEFRRSFGKFPLPTSRKQNGHHIAVRNIVRKSQNSASIPNLNRKCTKKGMMNTGILFVFLFFLSSVSTYQWIGIRQNHNVFKLLAEKTKIMSEKKEAKSKAKPSRYVPTSVTNKKQPSNKVSLGREMKKTESPRKAIEFTVPLSAMNASYSFQIRRRDVVNKKLHVFEQSFDYCKQNISSLYRQILFPLVADCLPFSYYQTVPVSRSKMVPSSDKDLLIAGDNRRKVLLLHKTAIDLIGKCMVTMCKLSAINQTDVIVHEDSKHYLAESISLLHRINQEYRSHLLFPYLDVTKVSSDETDRIPYQKKFQDNDPTHEQAAQYQDYYLPHMRSMVHTIVRAMYLAHTESKEDEREEMIHLVLHALLVNTTHSTESAVSIEKNTAQKNHQHTWLDIVLDTTNRTMEAPDRVKSFTHLRKYYELLRRVTAFGERLKAQFFASSTPVSTITSTDTEDTTGTSLETYETLSSDILTFLTSFQPGKDQEQQEKLLIEDINELLRLVSKYSLHDLLFQVYSMLPTTATFNTTSSSGRVIDTIIADQESREYFLNGMFYTVLREHKAVAMKTLPPANSSIPEVYYQHISYM